MNAKLRISISALLAATALCTGTPAAAVPVSIAPAGFGFGIDYAQANLLIFPNCTRRALRGAPGDLLTGPNGGVDGFDCGLNLVVQIADPFVVDVTAPGPQIVKIGEAALNERAIITLGQFPRPNVPNSLLPGGDGQSLANLGVFALLDVGGTQLRFDGTPSFYEGGAPAFGNPALIAICDTPNHPNLEFTPQCINDAALDFQIDFTATGANSIAIGDRLYTFALESLAFHNNSVIPINAVVTVRDNAVSEPGVLALFLAAMAAWGVSRRRR